jgi:hypothetical protein
MGIVFYGANRGKIIVVLYTGLVWFVAAALGGITGNFDQPPGAASVPFYLTVSVPLLLFLAGYFFWGAFRRFVQRLIGDPWWIVALQVYRVLGVVFVVLAGRNILPAMFALPAGWGDFLIGLTAPLVALAWSSGTRWGKGIFVIWNVVGMLDLVMAVSLATLASTILPGSVTMAPIRVFPLSLIPTFAVPLSFMLHFVALAQFWYLASQKEANSYHQAAVMA